jgi:hypothetical protein
VTNDETASPPAQRRPSVTNYVVQVTGDSPEAVALALFAGIAAANGKLSGGIVKADKSWVLSTYYECLTVVKGRDPRNPGGASP